MSEGTGQERTGLTLGQLETVLERIEEMVGVIRVEAPGRYRIMAVNRAYSVAARRERRQAAGLPLEEWLGAEGFPAWDARLREIIAFKRNLRFESPSYTLDPPQQLEFDLTPILDARGEAGHILAVGRNVTELKRVQERLRHSEKMEAVGQLAGGIAHDFNNLLTAINGFAYLALIRPDMPEDMREYIDGIRRSGERAAALTSQLLAYSRKSVLMPALVNLNTAVGEMEKILRRLIQENINVIARLQPDLGLVKVDPGQISQVILNLAINARDAMPEGGTLVLETRNARLPGDGIADPADAAPGRYAILSVRDDGAGMPPDVKARIFEPFFTTKEPGRGTGLGLSSVYGIVRQSGGHITVQSEPGRGSTFRIYLPVAPGSPAAAGPSAAEAPPRGRESILLVEDEEPVRAFVRRALEVLGYEVREAAGGEQALRLLEARRDVDLLITDLIMPGMAGTALAQRARAARPGLKVLYISGYADDAMLRLALSDKEAQFLQKPFSPSQLAQRVRHLLDRQLADRRR